MTSFISILVSLLFLVITYLVLKVNKLSKELAKYKMVWEEIRKTMNLQPRADPFVNNGESDGERNWKWDSRCGNTRCRSTTTTIETNCSGSVSWCSKQSSRWWWRWWTSTSWSFWRWNEIKISKKFDSKGQYRCWSTCTETDAETPSKSGCKEPSNACERCDYKHDGLRKLLRRMMRCSTSTRDWMWSSMEWVQFHETRACWKTTA